jgi:hypothetical protein
LHFVPKIQPTCAPGSKQRKYYMDIDDEFSRHLLSGDVHEDELAIIRETTTKHEP